MHRMLHNLLDKATSNLKMKKLTELCHLKITYMNIDALLVKNFELISRYYQLIFCISQF